VVSIARGIGIIIPGELNAGAVVPWSDKASAGLDGGPWISVAMGPGVFRSCDEVGNLQLCDALYDIFDGLPAPPLMPKLGSTSLR
jgi:hypothetical protein